MPENIKYACPECDLERELDPEYKCRTGTLWCNHCQDHIDAAGWEPKKEEFKLDVVVHCPEGGPMQINKGGETKPPMGLRPMFIVERQRTIEILQAITRYITAGESIPQSWTNELHILLRKVEK